MFSSIIVSPRYLRVSGHTPNQFRGADVVTEGFLEEGELLHLSFGFVIVTAVLIIDCWRDSLEALEVIQV